ncbi:MAG: hypothetical protein WDO15_19640 [Bacteroidota bacterium]
MDFIDIIKAQRDLYLKQLTEFYSEQNPGAKEILLELNGDEPEKIFKLYRLDHFEQIDGEGKPTELAADRYLNHQMTSFLLGNLSVELNPFYWHGCDFVFDQELHSIEWLKSWATKWIDVEDNNPVDFNGFSGVIHNVTRPQQNNGEWQFSVDFGTANEKAFIELIQAIDELRISRVRIGSFEMIP